MIHVALKASTGKLNIIYFRGEKLHLYLLKIWVGEGAGPEN
jgi:hypothetical protein